MNRYIITEIDILTHSYKTAEQLLLSILKDKGAPVKGLFWLEPNFEEYNWYRSYHTDSKTLIFDVDPK
jgi:hypothetical protein